MRLNLNEPVTQPRWAWLGISLAAVVMALIVLSDRLPAGSFFEPFLIAGVALALIGSVIVTVAAFKAHSSN